MRFLTGFNIDHSVSLLDVDLSIIKPVSMLNLADATSTVAPARLKGYDESGVPTHPLGCLGLIPTIVSVQGKGEMAVGMRMSGRPQPSIRQRRGNLNGNPTHKILRPALYLTLGIPAAAFFPECPKNLA